MKRTLIGVFAGLAIVAAAAIAADNFNVLDKLNISFSTATITGQLAPANGGSGVANSKNLTWSNSLTLAGTDATTMIFPSTSATIARTDAANTFTGTQTVGALVATTVNGNTVTTGTGTLTLGAGKTLTSSNTLTVAATDGSTLTLGAAGDFTALSSYTPAYQGSTGTIGATAYGTQVGNSIRIGKLAFVTFYVALSNKGSWTGDVQITLPYTAANVSNVYWEGNCSASTVTFTQKYLVAQLAPNTNFVNIILVDTAASGTPLQTTGVANTSAFICTMTYLTT